MNQLLSQQAALSVIAQQQALAQSLASPAGAAAQQNPAQLLIAAQLAQLQAAQLTQLGWPLQNAGLGAAAGMGAAAAGMNALNPAADITNLYANHLGLNMGLAQLAGLQVSTHTLHLATLKLIYESETHFAPQ